MQQNKKVLIITHTNDDNNCAETVADAVKNQGGYPIRIDVDRYPISHQFSSIFEQNRWEIFLHHNNEVHRLNEFSGIWIRRIHDLGAAIHHEVADDFVAGCVHESEVTLTGMLSHLAKEVFFINSYDTLLASNRKESQLRIAHELGIKIPKTCITNHPSIAKNFITQCSNGAIAKLQHNFKTYENGVEGTVFTNAVTHDDLEALNSLCYSPMQFQEKIAKKLELRIIMAGEQLYSFALDSQAYSAGKDDWRKVGLQSINDWYAYPIPAVLQHQLQKYQQHFCMNYGAADFILTPEDEFVFLEVNPTGEFFWIDRLLDYEISQQIASLLLGTVHRYPYSPYFPI